jgi:TonB family protein
MAQRTQSTRAHDPSVPKPLLLALTVSLVLHVVVLAVQLAKLDWKWPAPAAAKDDLHVLYEYQAAKQQLSTLRQQLSDLGARAGVVPAASGQGPQIRIPQRASLGLPGPAPAPTQIGAMDRQASGQRADGGTGEGGAAARPGSGPTRSAVVDLTNLVEAAQGNPVLLSYFSVIREQIQMAANRQTWLTGEQAVSGVVYLSFVLDPSGRVSTVSVLSDRSASAKQLHEISKTIIKSASPFPPFPPSIGDPAKTIVVPLEFLAGS